MTVVTVTKENDAMNIQFPADLELKEGQQFLAIKKNDAILLVPKLKNQFEQLLDDEIAESEYYSLSGEEIFGE